MRIGIGITTYQTTGQFDQPWPTSTWPQLRAQALAAEVAGFDLCVVDDQLVHGDHGCKGGLESVSVLGALVAVTSRIHIGHSMMNAPYRTPTHIAKVATSLDELSGGRYVLGLGAGNTPEADYAAVGVPAERRYSRFAETIGIVHALLRTGEADVEGTFHHARGARLEPRPAPGRLPIVIAAWGPKMMRLTARFADEWNGFTYQSQVADSFRPMLDELDRACEEVGRDPATLARSVDVALDPRPLEGRPSVEGLGPHLVGGTTAQMTERIAELGQIGIGTVRCLLWPEPDPQRRAELICALGDVVRGVHAA